MPPCAVCVSGLHDSSGRKVCPPVLGRILNPDWFGLALRLAEAGSLGKPEKTKAANAALVDEQWDNPRPLDMGLSNLTGIDPQKLTDRAVFEDRCSNEDKSDHTDKVDRELKEKEQR